MLTIGAAAIAFIAAWYFLNRNVLLQQLVLAFIYLFSLTIVGTTDILLPLYCVVVTASLLPEHIHSVSATTIFIVAVYLVYIIIGFFVQDFTFTCINFLSKFFQFCIPIAILESDLKTDAKTGKKTLLLCLIAECILGIMTTFISGHSLKEIVSVQLTSAAQPVVGNIAVVGLPLLCFMYCKNRKNTYETDTLIFISLGLGLWVVLSGIRGYLALFAIAMFPLYIDYMFGFALEGGKQYHRRMKMLYLFVFALVIALIWLPQLSSYISERILRLKNGTLGSRTYENAMTWHYLKRASVGQICFGIGLAGRLGDYPAFQISAMEQGQLGMWGIDNILNSRGTFHSLYDNIFLRQGLMGVLLLILTVFVMCKAIHRQYRSFRLLQACLYMYLAGFLVMNYFRWSADCGITEMIILALVLKIGSGGICDEKGASYPEIR